MFVPDVRYRDYFCRCLYWNYDGGLYFLQNFMQLLFSVYSAYFDDPRQVPLTHATSTVLFLSFSETFSQHFTVVCRLLEKFSIPLFSLPCLHNAHVHYLVVDPQDQ